MENRINSRIVIAVNKKNKLLGYLRKANSGEIEGVSVRLTHAPKEKPINLFFIRSGVEDNYLVYARHGEVMSKEIVMLGSANIKPIQETGFVSVGNKESKECVVIDIYAKEYALNFKDLQDILFSLIRLTSYPSLSTSSTTILELKPENQNIISYEVLMLAKNPLEPIAVKRAIDLAAGIDPNYTYHSKNSNSTVTESEKGTQEVLRQRRTLDSKRSNNAQLEIVIASSIIKSDLKKPLKKWNKILEAKPIEIFTHIDLKVGHVLGFYIKKSAYEINNVAIDDEKIYRYELVVKYSLNDCIVNSKSRGITTPGFVLTGFVLKALHNAYAEYKQRKSENLDISRLESLLKENKKTSNQKGDKDLINIIAEALREIEGIGKASINKCSKTAATEDLFCKKAKANSKKNNNTTRPYQVPSPVVTILTNDESKEKVKEIIEEANKAKSFPYMLDYDNNCVVKISDNLFDILECRNKLEDILKIRKDIDVGIFALESPYTVFKKLFNISSLTVYHSASKNLYALIGA